jgi:DNA polymerase III subunit epsilon
MITLQQKLRALRGWQHKTMAALLKATPGQRIENLCRLEQGDSKMSRAVLTPVSSFDKTQENLAQAYGLTQETLVQLLQDEQEWRMCAGTPEQKGQGLPRLARYLYRPLPEVAHNLFTDGFVLLDCETTGKDPHTGTGLCEITILDTDGTPLLSSLVNPGCPISEEARAVHGITEDMVKDAPMFREIGPEIARLIDGQIVVIYNAGFDAWLLDRLFIENGLDMPDFQQWCLMLAYAEYHQAPGKYPGQYAWQSLSVACEQQGVEQDGEAHRTMADTMMTWKLLQTLALQSSKKAEASA